MTRNAKQQRTLNRLFEKPQPAEMRWDDIESLLVALGATITQRAGSRVAATLNGLPTVFHVPHPERIAAQGRIRAVRKFLEDAGVQP